MGIYLPFIEWMSIGHNYFTGDIPLSMSNITHLRGFDAGGNQLHVNIPKSLGMLNNLEVFSAWTEQHRERKNGDLDFLSSFANMSNLLYLFLINNQFGE